MSDKFPIENRFVQKIGKFVLKCSCYIVEAQIRYMSLFVAYNILRNLLFGFGFYGIIFFLRYKFGVTQLLYVAPAIFFTVILVGIIYDIRTIRNDKIQIQPEMPNIKVGPNEKVQFIVCGIMASGSSLNRGFNRKVFVPYRIRMTRNLTPNLSPENVMIATQDCLYFIYVGIGMSDINIDDKNTQSLEFSFGYDQIYFRLSDRLKAESLEQIVNSHYGNFKVPKADITGIDSVDWQPSITIYDKSKRPLAYGISRKAVYKNAKQDIAEWLNTDIA